VPDAPPLPGYRSNEDWDALLAELNARIERIEHWPDADTKRQVFELLNGIDAVHREALHRLVRLFKQGVLEQVVTDPAIHTLMELYDLLPPSAAPAPAPKFPTIPIRAVPVAAPPAPARYPRWVPALCADTLPSGATRDVVVDGVPLVLARRDGAWYALAGACPLDGAALSGASFSGYTLSCPIHAGCHYDVRNGARVGGGAPLACYPVRVDGDGRVLVGFEMDFKPSLPSF